MKPLYLEMQAFGPYVEKQTVNFQKLAEKGILLIKGKTGSGKTTILDAIMVALYGGGSGETEKSAGRNKFEEWRCSQAPASLETFVSFTFSIHGRTYRFYRGLVQKRVNLSEKYDAAELGPDGNWIPLFENPKQSSLNAKAAELIGLTKDQFRQVVLLPQGQFEQFLLAPSDAKEEILKVLFGTERWSAYVESFYSEAKQRSDALAEELRQLQQSLEEEKQESLAGLEEYIRKLEEDKEKAETRHREFDGANKRKLLEEDKKLFEQFKPLHGAEQKQQQLLEQKLAVEEARNRLAVAEKAECLRRPMENYLNAKSALADREAAEKTLANQLKEAEKCYADCEEQLRLFEQGSQVENDKKDLLLYDSKKTVYLTLQERKQTHDNAQSETERLEKELKKANRKLDSARQQLADAKAAYDNACAETKDYRDRYYSEIYGIAARELVEGAKCPVCGSLHHPEPAKLSPDSVSKAQVDAREEAEGKAKDLMKKAEGSLAVAENEQKSLNDSYQAALNKSQLAEAEYKQAQGALLTGIDSLEALNTVVKDTKSRIENYEKHHNLLNDKKGRAKNAQDVQRGKAVSAGEERAKAEADHKEAEAALQSALAATGYQDVATAQGDMLPGDKHKALQERITKYETTCQNNAAELARLQAELENKQEPDDTLFAARDKAIADEEEDYYRQTSSLSVTIKRLKIKSENLQEKQKHYDANHIEAENDLKFAKTLRGESSIGLQRYVLAVMFDQVLHEANRMLAKVHNGRYYLFRTDDKGGRKKRGLELKVHDARSPEQEGRPVAMLSGGEKFLVSLALSIGMSAIAQRSGIRMEALFIDEGFGTLDESSITDAIEILEGIRQGHGMIGIISHVALLDSTLQNKIEVVKADTGNYILGSN